MCYNAKPFQFHPLIVMAIVCPSCGKENRDQARFCRGCARPLDRPGGDAASDEVARERANRALRRARRRNRSGESAERPAWWRWAGAMTAGVLVLAAGWWLGAHQSAPAPVQAAPLAGAPAASSSATPTAGATATATAPPTAVEPVGADAASPNTPEAAAAVDRLRQSVELLEQQDRERAAAQAAQRQKLALEQKRLEDARRRTETTAAVAASAHSAAPEPAPPVAVAAPAASAPVAAAAAPPSAARPAAGVDQLCAGSDNVFARDFCRIRECGKAVFANDPVCVRFRQMDEARRREAEYR